MSTSTYNLPNEAQLEKHIVDSLTSVYERQPAFGTFSVTASDRYVDEFNDYTQISPIEYDKDLCIIPSEFIGFLRNTQPEKYKKLLKQFGGNEEDANKAILSQLSKQLDKGTLYAFRENDLPVHGTHFHLLYTLPESGRNEKHIELYKKNRLAVVRQLLYSKKNNNEIDLALFVNGLPVVLIELKNTLTGQTHHEAIKQFMRERPTKGEPLFDFKRVLVYFAVGTEQVYMTTKLDGEKTRFFPFNMCFNNNGVKSRSGYRTSYLWEDVLRRDSLIDLIQNFIQVQVNKETYFDEKTGTKKTESKEVLIFPRWHQRRAVHKLVADARAKGAGHRYLIQHSAGSGKSNTIAWLAFRLSSIYDTNDKHVFDSVIVVTDRCNLNDQLSNNIKQFEKYTGWVETLNDRKTSQDLKNAIESQRRIIVTTLQKFPVIADEVKKFPNRKYAVIIDEAHSSQSGEDARQMRKALSLEEAERFENKVESEEDRDEMMGDAANYEGIPTREDKLNHKIRQEIEKKGLKTNVSFFAFTATPKDKTIELFCEREHGTKEPFDLYTMEEAIKEGFIRNVLENYMSFKRYYRLVRDNMKVDKEYDVKKAVRLLNSYVDLQDTAIERKSRIMIEHFASQTQNEIEGKARAMLVTRSRLHAVRYKLQFDQIMQEMRLPYRALVAFSGTVKDEETGLEYTESSMNHLQGNFSIPEAFKLSKYRILIVANKFQTGFDEPWLHTMFVDKKLGSTNTVQTLSRLNRIAKAKDSTMVLDFVNDPEQVRQDFQAFYGKNFIEECNETDPNSLYDLQSKVKDFKFFHAQDVETFAHIFFEDNTDKAKLNSVLDQVCDNIIKDDEGIIDLFRKSARAFCNLYKFLSQIITFTDENLEKYYVFLTALIKKLPYVKEQLPYDVLNESELESYKVQYQYMAHMTLESGNNSGSGQRPGDAIPSPEAETDFLSNIIRQLNDTFGLDLTEDDKVEIHKLKEKVTANEELMSYFNPQNTRDNIKDKFSEEVDNELLDFINSKIDLYNKLSEDKANNMFKTLWFNELYDSRVRGLK